MAAAQNQQSGLNALSNLAQLAGINPLQLQQLLAASQGAINSNNTGEGDFN